MSMHYLIDAHSVTNPVIDVTSSESGQVNTTGALTVLSPRGVEISGNPTTLSALLTAKSNGLLAAYTGYSSIVFDGCLTPGVVDLASSSQIQVGNGLANHCVLPDGVLTTVPLTLGFAPGQCIVAWDAYSVSDAMLPTGRISRQCTEVNPNSLACTITFDNLNPYSAISGASLGIFPGDQGINAVLTFSNTGGSRLFLGSLAIIY